MARKRYKAYSSRRSRRRKKKHGKLIVVLIIIIAAGVYLIKRTNNDDTTPVDTSPSMEDILATDYDDPVKADTSADVPPEVAIVEVEPAEATVEVLNNVPIVEDNSVTSEAAQARISKAEVHLAAGAVIAARLELNGALNLPLSTADRREVKSKMTELANDWLFSKKIYDEDKLVGKYNVRPGDVLENISRSHKVSHQVLMWINGLSSPRALQAGSVIKIVNGPFNVIVDRSDFTMDLYLQNMYVKSYGVGLGREGNGTPVGEWCVKTGGKMVQPQWYDEETRKTYYKDDSDYPLGARWIGIKGLDENTKPRIGFALHGTKEPDTIGVRSSRGCIRLIDKDIIELYGLLAPVHSRVRIVD